MPPISGPDHTSSSYDNLPNANEEDARISDLTPKTRIKASWLLMPLILIWLNHCNKRGTEILPAVVWKCFTSACLASIYQLAEEAFDRERRSTLATAESRWKRTLQSSVQVLGTLLLIDLFCLDADEVQTLRSTSEFKHLAR
jgi:hypothetical protein